MIEWKALESREQIDEIVRRSHATPVVIYKHSRRCGVNAVVKKRLEKDWKNGREVDFYFLDLVTFREVSDEVARRFGVRHESPQIILIHEGKAVFDASHGGVSAGALRNFLTQDS